MRLQINRLGDGQQVIISLEPDEAQQVIAQLQQGLAQQGFDRTHTHSIVLPGIKESRRDVVQILINGEVS